ncbi:MAG: tripartite tricarboxylate transporter permease [Rubrivivax sp.]
MGSLDYLLAALTPLNLLLALAGVVAGTVIGALPGLTATMAVAVLVPFTFSMAPAAALIALGAIYTGAIYGGAYAAILLNTPGTPSSIATTFDGYPMARAGRGDLALTLSCLASVIGGLVGAGFLLLLAPPMATVALKFGPVEYFWLAVFGLTLIASLGEGSTVKGLLGGCLGLLLAMVGVAEVGGDIRYVGSFKALLGGIDIVSALIGLYCVPVLIELVATPARHLEAANRVAGFRLREAGAIMARGKLNLARSSVIGTLVGILPGAGGSIASLVAYSEAKRASPRRAHFGRGEPDGVLATESANNATVGGGFIPTLVLGIPGTPPDAIILGALLVQGIRTGPTLFTQQAPIVYTFIWGLILATVIMLPVGLLIGRFAFQSILAIPKAVLVPAVALLTVLGSYSVHNNVQEVQQMAVLGVAAWGLSRFGFTASPIVLGLILGSIAERGFVQGNLIGGARGSVPAEFFGRPISIAIIAFIALGLLWPWWQQRRQRRGEPAVPPPPESATPVTTALVTPSPAPDRAGAAGVVLMMGIGAAALTFSSEFSDLGSVFPRAIGTLLIVLGALYLLRVWRGLTARGEALEGSTPRRIAVAAVMLGWAFALPWLGFLGSGAVAFALLLLVAHHGRWTPRRALLYALVGSVLLGALYALFKLALKVPLP